MRSSSSAGNSGKLSGRSAADPATRRPGGRVSSSVQRAPQSNQRTGGLAATASPPPMQPSTADSLRRRIRREARRQHLLELQERRLQINEALEHLHSEDAQDEVYISSHPGFCKKSAPEAVALLSQEMKRVEQDLLQACEEVEEEERRVGAPRAPPPAT